MYLSLLLLFISRMKQLNNKTLETLEGFSVVNERGVIAFRSVRTYWRDARIRVQGWIQMVFLRAPALDH